MAAHTHTIPRTATHTKNLANNKLLPLQCNVVNVKEVTKYLRIQFHNFHKAALNVSQTT
jgi:hypothetical protein